MEPAAVQHDVGAEPAGVLARPRDALGHVGVLDRHGEAGAELLASFRREGKRSVAISLPAPSSRA